MSFLCTMELSRLVRRRIAGAGAMQVAAPCRARRTSQRSNQRPRLRLRYLGKSIMLFARFSAAANASRLHISFSLGRNFAVRLGSSAAAVATVVALVAGFAPLAASANTYTWTGASSINWSDVGNWGGGLAGDRRRWSVRRPLVPQPANDRFHRRYDRRPWNSGTAAVTISPNGAGVLTLTATNVGGQAATGILLDANAGGMTIGAPILLAGNQSWTTSSAFNALTITNSISLGGNTLTPAVSMSGCNDYQRRYQRRRAA